uniref:Uncharacterized protein n=1 Tax=Anguilla anguilla TaxID=7936 RepID=A0A0E9PH37_ANGAN
MRPWLSFTARAVGPVISNDSVFGSIWLLIIIRGFPWSLCSVWPCVSLHVWEVFYCSIICFRSALVHETE